MFSYVITLVNIRYPTSQHRIISHGSIRFVVEVERASKIYRPEKTESRYDENKEEEDKTEKIKSSGDEKSYK